MEYLIIIALQIIGVFAHVLQKTTDIKKAFPTYKFREIVSTFWDQDWNTIAFSVFVGIPLDLLGHFIAIKYVPGNVAAHPWYFVWSFVIALFLGYAGQRFIYKHLGTLETFLDKQVDSRIPSN
jgi:hypothetical protein